MLCAALIQLHVQERNAFFLASNKELVNNIIVKHEKSLKKNRKDVDYFIIEEGDKDNTWLRLD